MKTAKTYSRKPWTKLITPEQFNAIMSEYEAGASTPDLCAKYRVSRSWLYRERKRWIQTLNPQDSITCLKAENARLRELVVKIASAKIFGDSDEVENLAKAG